MIELLALAALLGAVFSVEESRERSRRSYVGAILRRHTEVFLNRMQKKGWFPGGSRTLSHERPTEWDINCGACAEWAEEARKLLGGGEVRWLDELVPVDPEEISHCIFVLDGRLYDSQHPDGVDTVEELDLFRQVSREDYLQRRLEQRDPRPPVYVSGAVVGVHDYYGEPGIRELEHAFKAGDPAAIEQVCADLAPYVPADAVLVAMPGRTGRATNTAELVRCLSSVTGRPWSVALVGDSRPSLCDAKREGRPLPELHLRVEGRLPPGRPVVVDHVLATGSTAEAALNAFPEGSASVLVHAVDLSSAPPPAPAIQKRRGAFVMTPSGRLVGYRACRYDPVTDELVSGADSRLRMPGQRTPVHRMPGKGMFLTSDRQYAVDHYAGHDCNAVCRYLFWPSDVTSGSLEDREPEISVSEAELAGFRILDADGKDWTKKRLSLEVRCADDRGALRKDEDDLEGEDKDSIEDFEETVAAQEHLVLLGEKVGVHVDRWDAPDKYSNHSDCYVRFTLPQLYLVVDMLRKADIDGDVLDVPEGFPEAISEDIEKRLGWQVEG